MATMVGKTPLVGYGNLVPAGQVGKAQMPGVQKLPYVAKVGSPSQQAGPANFGAGAGPTSAYAQGGVAVPSNAGGGYNALLNKANAGARERSPEELEHLKNVSGLASLLSSQGSNLYNVGTPAYSRAMDYYNRILSGDKGAVTQAIAPEAEMLAEFGNAQQKGIENSGLRGGARDTALAEAGRGTAGQIAGLIPQARRDAANAAAGHGLAGAQAGAGITQGAANTYAGLLGSAQESRQFGADLQAKIALGMRSGDLEAARLDLERYLGEKGLDLQRLLGMSNLQLQREMGLMGFDMDQQKINIMRQQMNAQLQQQRQGNASGIGGAVGAILGTAAGALFGSPQMGAALGQTAGSAAGSFFGGR